MVRAEALESRNLFAADLSVVGIAAFTGPGKGAGSVVVTNVGTVATTGTFDVAFYATAPGQKDQLLGQAKGKSAKLAVHGSTTAAIKIDRPVNTTKKAINFQIVERITPHTTPADTKALNNTFKAGSILVTPAGGTTNGSNPFSSLHVGNVFKFTKTEDDSTTVAGIHIVNESGTVTDNTGRSGTYTLALTPGAFGGASTLDIEIDRSSSDGDETLLFHISTYSGITTFAKKSVTINLVAAGSKATATSINQAGKFYFHVA